MNSSINEKKSNFSRGEAIQSHAVISREEASGSIEPDKADLDSPINAIEIHRYFSLSGARFLVAET